MDFNLSVLPAFFGGCSLWIGTHYMTGMILTRTGLPWLFFCKDYSSAESRDVTFRTIVHLRSDQLERLSPVNDCRTGSNRVLELIIVLISLGFGLALNPVLSGN